MIIDFHTHTLNYEFLQPWLLDRFQQTCSDYEAMKKEFADPANFSRFIRESSIDYAVMMADMSEQVTGLCSNEIVYEFCQEQNNLIPFCNINPREEKDAVGKLRTLVRDMGFRGLKLYPTYQHFYMYDAIMYPLYEAAQELQIPVIYHSGLSVFKGSRIKYGEPMHIDDVAVDFPDLVLVIAHSGRGFWYDQAATMARIHKNVYMEISGLPPRKLLEYFPDLERLQDKVVFGSDWPEITDIRKSIDTIKGLPISDTAKDKILGKNAQRVLNIE